MEETEEQITSTWYVTCVTVFAPGAVAHREYAFSFYLTQLNQHRDVPGRSDTARSKDLTQLKGLLEEKSSEYAELLKQQECSLARYAASHGCICNPVPRKCQLESCIPTCSRLVVSLHLPVLHRKPGPAATRASLALKTMSQAVSTCRVTSDLSERSRQLKTAQTDAQQTFQQSEAKHADLLSQLKTAQLATQQAHDAQVEAEQQLQTTQQASAQKLNQVTADFDQQVHATKHSAYEEFGEKLQILQQECEDQVAAARSEAQQLEAEHQDRIQHLQQQLEAAHHDSKKQLQQQLQACQQDCESLQAEKLALEQQVQSAKADSARDLQDLRDKTKSAVAAQMRQHSLKLEDEKSAHNKATSRLQLEVAELQAALERQQEDSAVSTKCCKSTWQA